MKIKCELNGNKTLANMLTNSKKLVIIIEGVDTFDITSNYAPNKFDATLMVDGFPIEPTSELLGKIELYSDIGENVSNIDNQSDFTRPVSSLFSSSNNQKTTERTPVDRIAATIPPENKDEVAHAFKTQQEVNEKPPLPELKNPEVRKFIADANSFFDAVNASRNKKSDIDIDSIQDPRKKAAMMEKMNMDESIGMPAFVVNEKYAFLTVNDLDVNLMLNNPTDLAKIPARKLYASNDLKTLLAKKMIRFVSPEEAAAIFSKQTETEEYGLKVFDNHSKAKANMKSDSDDDEDGGGDGIIELDDNNINGPTEEEQIHKTINSPNKTQTLSGGIKKIIHGNKPSANTQQAVHASQGKKPQIKPIKAI